MSPFSFGGIMKLLTPYAHKWRIPAYIRPLQGGQLSAMSEPTILNGDPEPTAPRSSSSLASSSHASSSHASSVVQRRAVLGVAALGLLASACSGGSGDAQSVTSSTDPTGQKDSKTLPRSNDGGSGGGGSGDSGEGATVVTGALGPADFEGLGTCMLLPEQMAGPFPLDEQFDRRDITEGYPGQPMRLGLRVIDESCLPIAGAAVEVWHCDATGDYSAFIDDGGGKDEGAGTTFLRGTQSTGDDGIVEFLTIVPGWYTGRAVHVHLRVHIEGNIVLTSQMYFDADYVAGVYRTEPYAQFGPPDTPNEQDAIAGKPGTDGTLLHTRDAITSGGQGTLALLNLGVKPS